MTDRRTYDLTRKEQVFATLRREILAARLKVTLDEQLHRETSPTVKHLTGMKLPPIAKAYCRSRDTQADAVAPVTSHERGQGDSIRSHFRRSANLRRRIFGCNK